MTVLTPQNATWVQAKPGAGHFWLHFWCLFKSDPPEGRKGGSAPPEKTDLLTIPMPNPTNPANPTNPVHAECQVQPSRLILLPLRARSSECGPEQARSYSFGVNQQHAAYRQIAILGLSRHRFCPQGVGAAGVALHLAPRSAGNRQQTRCMRSVRHNRVVWFCCRCAPDRGTSHAPTVKSSAGRLMHRPRKRGALAPVHAVHIRDSPDSTNRDLGAGQTQTTRSGSSGMDAARAPSGHGCPFGAGPRSVVGVRVPEERGPNQELGTFGYFWCLFKSDPPEGRKGESAPPEITDLPTLPTPNPTIPDPHEPHDSHEPNKPTHPASIERGLHGPLNQRFCNQPRKLFFLITTGLRSSTCWLLC
ncbi:hypothetical protein SAMN03159444_01059 [Pseudomonas sp. NFACC02]|nr:hypothetical protein SAMN03159444_01059 [Pseudomonas sp. NFACC02]